MSAVMTPQQQAANDVAVAIAVGLKEWSSGQKHNATGSPQSTGYMHGNGGLLSYPGVDPLVYATEQGILPGLISLLPSRASRYTDPLYEVWTGQYGDNGSERAAECDPAPTPGLAKAGLTWAPFGRYARSTPELSLARLGQLRDNADPVGLRFANMPNYGQGPMNLGPEASGDFIQDMLTNELSAALRRRNVSMHRLLARQVWRGNPANNNGTAYMEFVGMNRLVATGYKDAVTGTLLPSVDSDIKNFNYARIDANGGGIVDAVQTMFRYVRQIAERSGALGVEWVLVMREELFWELTKVWPYYYLTNYFNPSANTQSGVIVNIDARDQTEFRDRLRRERFLTVDGYDIPVVTDDGIIELDGNSSGGNFPRGCFASDIFLVPLTVNGGAVTFTEYFDFDNIALQQAAAMLQAGVQIRGNGAFLEFKRLLNNCFAFELETQPRIIMRTPWLAARLNNVVYCPLQHTREPFPDDPYFVNGGVTSRPGASYYAGWKS